jgi:hypothetical protein
MIHASISYNNASTATKPAPPTDRCYSTKWIATTAGRTFRLQFTAIAISLLRTTPTAKSYDKTKESSKAVATKTEALVGIER